MIIGNYPKCWFETTIISSRCWRYDWKWDSDKV